MGLQINPDRTTLKCYMGDTGLLFKMAFIDQGEKNEVYRKIILGKLALNEGMFTENVVAQLFAASGHSLFFYSNCDRENKDARMELDFLVPKSRITNAHNINFIEVKSGTRYSLVSLKKAMLRYANEMHRAIVIHPNNLCQEGGIIYLPLYMAGLL